MPQKERTQKDRIYLEMIRNRGALTNIELANEARSHPWFRNMTPSALEKDVDRFVGRHIGKTIARADGRLRIIEDISRLETERQNWRHAHDLLHIQVDVRDIDTKRVLHEFWYEKIKNISNSPLTTLNQSFFSDKPQTWEERNPVIELKQGAATKRYDKENKPRFSHDSNPYQLRFEMDFPRKLYKGQTVIERISYDEKDLEPNFTITDLTPVERLVFDLIKSKTDNESLDCMIRQRSALKGEYARQIGKSQMVTNLLTRSKVYALRIVMDNPKAGLDYRFEYQI